MSSSSSLSPASNQLRRSTVFPAVIVALLLATSIVSANNCSISPLSLPITNVTLSDGIAINRGVYLKLGNQILSLRLATTLNNTSLRNERDCELGNATLQSECLGASGSTYAPQDSSTWEQAGVDEFAADVDAIDAHAAGESVIVGYDTASFSVGVEVNKYPVEIWSNLASSNRSGIALGLQSSFLQKLLDVSAAPSRAFGLYYGSRSQSNATDGSLTIGGIDTARVRADTWSNHSTGKQYLDYSCPLQVLIKDIRLNNSRGSFSLFADAGAIVPACIDPQQNAFTFTPWLYERWANLTEHPVNNSLPGEPLFTSQTYPRDKESLIGNLTVTLSDGFTTVIPHYELVSDERGSDIQGKYAVVNSSRVMAAVSSDGTEAIPILGGVYLTPNYLFVDYDRNTFGLATAVLGTSESKVILVCDSKPGGGTQSGGGAEKSSKGANIGAIVGTVVGGIAGLTILAAAIVIYRRHWRSDKASVIPRTDGVEVENAKPELSVESSRRTVSELGHAECRPSELPSPVL